MDPRAPGNLAHQNTVDYKMLLGGRLLSMKLARLVPGEKIESLLDLEYVFVHLPEIQIRALYG